MATEPRDIIAFFEGSNAFDDGDPVTANFYSEGTIEHSEWLRGWNYQFNDNDQTGVDPDEGLPTAEDVRGILSIHSEEPNQ